MNIVIKWAGMGSRQKAMIEITDLVQHYLLKRGKQKERKIGFETKIYVKTETSQDNTSEYIIF